MNSGGIYIPFHGYRIKEIGARGMLIFYLSVLAGYGAYVLGVENTLPQVAVCVLTALVVDGALNYIKRQELYISKPAIISGLNLLTLNLNFAILNKFFLWAATW